MLLQIVMLLVVVYVISMIVNMTVKEQLNNFLHKQNNVNENYDNNDRLHPSGNLNLRLDKNTNELVLQNDDLRGFDKYCKYTSCVEEQSQVQRERNEQLNRVCYFNHDHKKYRCNYGATNYLHPDNLTPFDCKLFKYNYYNNMTLQDYVNWLKLYDKEGDEYRLCYEHSRNLQKIKKGEPLMYQRNVCPPSLTIEQSISDRPSDMKTYYNKMLKESLI